MTTSQVFCLYGRIILSCIAEEVDLSVCLDILSLLFVFSSSMRAWLFFFAAVKEALSRFKVILIQLLAPKGLTKVIARREDLM